MLTQLSKILESMGFNEWALVVIILSVFIEITPAIKISPIKWLFGKLGEYFNSSVRKEIQDFKVEVNTKFDSLQSEQKKQRDTLDKMIGEEQFKELSRTRWEIIDFKTDLDNGVKHSRTQYRRILDSFDKYSRIINNSKIEDENYRDVKDSIDVIKKYYDEHKNDNISQLYF